jgi:hypothetical protein
MSGTSLCSSRTFSIPTNPQGRQISPNQKHEIVHQKFEHSSVEQHFPSGGVSQRWNAVKNAAKSLKMGENPQIHSGSLLSFE